jgi:DNA-binding NtrC family response regulator
MRSGMRVLVIEDDGAMRALLRDVLERAGHRVVERADGNGLPALVEQEPFDAVVLDKEMPGVNGLDLLAFLRQRLPEVPVIFITAFGGRLVAEEATRRGAFSYLEKPFRVDTVLDTLAAVQLYRIGAKPGR